MSPKASSIERPPFLLADSFDLVSYFSVALTPTRLTAAIAFQAFKSKHLI